MLIEDLHRYIPKKKKAIHVGACRGEERAWYEQTGFQGVLWLEPNPEAFQILKKNVAIYPNQIALNVGVHDTLKEAILRVTNNIMSSSILEMDKYLKYHPKVKYIKDIKVRMMSVFEIFETYGFSILDYNLLNVDVQGTELNVIKSFEGFENGIRHMDYIYAEINEEYLYKDCCLVGEIDAYLSNYGFERILTVMTKYKWGDALYERVRN